MMQYTAANALFQEVAVLNQYLASLERDFGQSGRKAYVVSFHIVVSPEQRNMPYDTYVDLSVLAQSGIDALPELPSEPASGASTETINVYMGRLQGYVAAYKMAIDGLSSLIQDGALSQQMRDNAGERTGIILPEVLRGFQASAASTIDEGRRVDALYALNKADETVENLAEGLAADQNAKISTDAQNPALPSALHDLQKRAGDVKLHYDALLKDEALRTLMASSQVDVIPLLATDSIESLMASNSQQNAVSLAAGLAGTISGIPVNVGANNVWQALAQMAGRQYNSTLLIGRTSRNTIRVRLGALLSAVKSTPAYVAVPMSHDISVIVLVPPTTTNLQVLTSRTFEDTTDSKSKLVQPTHAQITRAMTLYFNELVDVQANWYPLHEWYEDFLRPFGNARADSNIDWYKGSEPEDLFSWALMHDRDSVDLLLLSSYDELAADFTDGDFGKFSQAIGRAPEPIAAVAGLDSCVRQRGFKYLEERDLQSLLSENEQLLAPKRRLELEKERLVAMGRSNATDPDEALKGFYFRKFASLLWTLFADHRNLSGYSLCDVPLGENAPLSVRPIFPESLPASAYLFVNNNHLTMTLAGGHHFESLRNPLATLTLSFSSSNERLVLNADSITSASASASASAGADNTMLTLSFPLPTSFDLFGSNAKLSDSTATVAIDAGNAHPRPYAKVPLGDLSTIPGLGFLAPQSDQDLVFNVGANSTTVTLRGGQRLDLLRLPLAYLTINPPPASNADDGSVKKDAADPADDSGPAILAENHAATGGGTERATGKNAEAGAGGGEGKSGKDPGTIDKKAKSPPKPITTFSTATTYSADKSALTITFGDLTAVKVSGLGKDPSACSVDFKFSYYYNGVNKPENFTGKMVVLSTATSATATSNDASSSKVIALGADHITVADPKIVITIAPCTNFTTIAVQGANVVSMVPINTVRKSDAGVQTVEMSSDIDPKPQVPLIVPAAFKGGSYVLTFGDVSPTQAISLTVKGTASTNVPAVSEIDTIKVVNTTGIRDARLH